MAQEVCFSMSHSNPMHELEDTKPLLDQRRQIILGNKRFSTFSKPMSLSNNNTSHMKRNVKRSFTTFEEDSWEELFHQWQKLIQQTPLSHDIDMGSLSLELEEPYCSPFQYEGAMINFAIHADCTYGNFENGEIAGKLPAHTHRWLSFLLLAGYINCQSHLDRCILNQIVLMIHVTLSTSLFPTRESWGSMDDNEKAIWKQFSEIFGIGTSHTSSSGSSSSLLGTATAPHLKPHKVMKREEDYCQRWVEGGQDCDNINFLDQIAIFNANPIVSQLVDEQVVYPLHIKTQLKPYQLDSLRWMVGQERQKQSMITLPPNWTQGFTSEGKVYYLNQETMTTSWKFPYDQWAQHFDSLKQYDDLNVNACGGILADDMGMGKTVQILSLIATNQYSYEVDPEMKFDKTTLIVTPLSILKQWTQEIENHIKPNVLSVYVYHGGNRIKDHKILSSYDIILTTYSTLSSELNMKGVSQSPLGNINWYRIVLDEAHMIKDKNTRSFKALYQLHARSRWAVTGTPIQNKIGELYSLLAFLRVHPFSEYDWWNNIIIKPIRNKDTKGFTRLQMLISKILLRRTKQQMCLSDEGKQVPVLELPSKVVKVKRAKFNHEEQQFYDMLWAYGKEKFESLVAKETLFNNYVHILELLLRLRQACNHPRLVLSSKIEADTLFTSSWTSITLPDAPSPDCDVKVDPSLKYLNPPSMLDMSSANPSLMQSPFNPEKLAVSEDSLSNVAILHNALHLPRSAKVNALVEELKLGRTKEKCFKAIVFSQWTSMLDLIEPVLVEEKFKFVRLDGTMLSKQREETLETFKTDETISVFLISTKAGGLGLNLTIANYVYIMDPWWSSAPEEQAIDRVHRIGQKKTVTVIRFVIEGTIEERVLEIQEKKKRLAGLLNPNDQKAVKLEELRYLFS